MTISARLGATALVLMSVLWMMPARADFTGPGADGATHTVASVLKEGEYTMQVVLVGHIIRQTGHEKYVFSDGTGEIAVEIDSDFMPREPFNAETKVRIVGIYDDDFMGKPEIDVDFITLLSAMPSK